MKRIHILLTPMVLLFLFSVCLSLFSSPARAQTLILYGGAYQYSTKFMCSLNPLKAEGLISREPYARAIHIENPWPQEAKLNIKFTQSFSKEKSEPETLPKAIVHTLGPGKSLKLDCKDILPDGAMFPAFFQNPNKPSHRQGILVVESNRELKITPVFDD
ncbi:MAG: hypothetical protein ACMUIA_07025 [bacterium]